MKLYSTINSKYRRIAPGHINDSQRYKVKEANC